MSDTPSGTPVHLRLTPDPAIEFRKAWDKALAEARAQGAPRAINGVFIDSELLRSCVHKISELEKRVTDLESRWERRIRALESLTLHPLIEVKAEPDGDRISALEMGLVTAERRIKELQSQVVDIRLGLRS